MSTRTPGARGARRFWLSSAAALTIAALAAPGAQAQDEVAPADGTTDRIVVTAQFREQDLQDTPLSITAFTGEMLEARNQLRITDITAQAPNVQLQLSPAGAGNAMRAFIRGVGQADQSPSVDPGVGVYIDDIYFATLTASVFDLVDVDRVEILRGPQGTLSGMNSLGGSVKLYSRTPEGEGGYVQVTYGSYDRIEGRASADFTIVPDQLFARISAVTRDQDGYVKRYDYACLNPTDPYVVSGAMPRQNSGPDCQIGTLGGISMEAIRGSLRWAPSDDFEVTVIADAGSDDSETRASVLLNAAEFFPDLNLAQQGIPYDNRYVTYGPSRLPTQPLNDPFATYSTFTAPSVTYTPIDADGTAGNPNGPYSVRPVTAVDSSGLSAAIDWDIADGLSLKSITGYRTYDSIAGQDNDGSPASALQSEDIFAHEQLSQELRLSGDVADGFLEYTVGAYYLSQDTTYSSRVFAPFIPFMGNPAVADPFNFPIFDFVQSDTLTDDVGAVFAHAIITPIDPLSIALGVRYTDQEKTYTYHRLNIDGATEYLPLSNPSSPLNGLSKPYEDDHFDYRANVSYRITDGIMAYFEHATGFKAGGTAPRPYFAQQVIDFGPEELTSYEGGLKTQLFGDSLTANLSVFYNDYKDYQATPVDCVDSDGNLLPPQWRQPCGQYANVADAEVKGAELELAWEPLDGLTFDGSASYLDFEFKTPKIQTLLNTALGAAGIGDFKWSVGAQYELDFANGASLTPRVDVAGTPGYCGNLACTPLASNEDYTLVNGRVTFRSPDDEWSIALEGNNLTDELYYLNKFNSIYTNGQPGMPRTWAISIRRNF